MAMENLVKFKLFYFVKPVIQSAMKKLQKSVSRFYAYLNIKGLF